MTFFSRRPTTLIEIECVSIRVSRPPGWCHSEWSPSDVTAV